MSTELWLPDALQHWHWIPFTIFATGIVISCYRLHQIWRAKNGPSKRVYDEKPAIQREKVFSKIQSLDDFDWEKRDPLPLRPFKPVYNINMAIQSSSASELLEIDRKYIEMTDLRRQIMQDHRPTVLGANPRVKAAIDEFYTFLLLEYLPVRFPRMFRLDNNSTPSLHNMLRDEFLPLVPPQDPVKTFEIIGGLIEDDTMILMESQDGDGYTLEGFVCCFPNKFDTSKKLGLKLREIHGPVPSYKEKLQMSMDRYFERLPVGKYVKRVNWSVTPTEEMFSPPTDGFPSQIDVEEFRLRCERQILHRLPESKAIVFTFKTYVYPLSDLIADGTAPALADAIEGIEKGNAPAMRDYKLADLWDKQAIAYLRQQPQSQPKQ